MRPGTVLTRSGWCSSATSCGLCGPPRAGQPGLIKPSAGPVIQDARNATRRGEARREPALGQWQLSEINGAAGAPSGPGRHLREMHRPEQWAAAEALGLNPFTVSSRARSGRRSRTAGRSWSCWAPTTTSASRPTSGQKGGHGRRGRYGTGLPAAGCSTALCRCTPSSKVPGDWWAWSRRWSSHRLHGQPGLIATLVQRATRLLRLGRPRLAGGRGPPGRRVLRAFRHNRPQPAPGLQSWRSQPGSGGVLVAVDGIYSMRRLGALAEVRALCDQHQAGPGR